MNKLVLILLLISASYQCNSQSTETSLYLREELVRQRDDLLKQAKEIQARIDAIDKKLGTKTQSSNTVQYFTKTAKYNDGSYSRSIESERSRQYKTKTTKTYHRGPRGGCYYINSNGNKTYVARSMCN
ncbi:hypothetical protein [Aquimarina mytili]|uniref:Uncharacterized protein n=1 Tax=Aquimarina mytili TaxID=874423 RepID=A0A936ZP37_9FLAO|nr:hypothetical protein [Aquimarina mytili]MBL0682817.1 hypothetical protein [Aquimarina mytili]